MSVAVMIPSRDRPEQLIDACRSVLETSRATVAVYVDEDQADFYAGPMSSLGGSDRIRFMGGKRIGPVAAANLLMRANPGFDVYGLITDDARITTPKWDEWSEAAIEQAPNRILVIDPRHDLGEHVDMPFVSKEWIEVTGWYACPDFYHFCWPILTGLIGEMTAIIHAGSKDFGLHHLGLSHSNLRAREDDEKRFFNWAALKLPEVVDKLRRAMMS